MFGAIDSSIYMELLKKSGWMKQLEFDFPPVVYIRPEYVCDIGVGHSFNKYGSTSSQDHPAFTGLRNDLEKRGYIKTERGWSNGDRVLKPFYLNQVYFSNGEYENTPEDEWYDDRFPCAAAMKYDLRDGKYISSSDWHRTEEKEEPQYKDEHTIDMFS